MGEQRVEFINFMKERMNKEESLRLAFYIKWQKTINERVSQDEIRASMHKKMSPDEVTRIPLVPRERHPLKDAAPGQQARSPDDVGMKPVPEELHELIYDGISHEGKGRYNYLKYRYRNKPENKFAYPLTTSWDYGWHQGRFLKVLPAPKHGRLKVITTTFYRRTGVTND